MEVCLLNEMCANREAIFAKGEGDHFHCQFDARNWMEFGHAVRAMG